MFGLFKMKQPATIDGVVAHLQEMGYDLLAPHGYAVAVLQLKTGYSEAEIASHIALTTMAFDVRAAEDDFLKLTTYHAHAMVLLRLLKVHKDNGLIRPKFWENDAAALYHVVTVDQEQEAWVERILSDPLAGKARLAISRIVQADAAQEGGPK